MHCYLPIKTEVDTRPLIAAALDAGKEVIVPVVQGEDLLHVRLDSLDNQDMQPGRFGILQPRLLQQVSLGVWDVIIVPMLAFDRAGYRLGYGKGFYDRLLTTAPVPTIGVAFATQEAAHLPHDLHDVPLLRIVTETEVIIAPEVSHIS